MYKSCNKPEKISYNMQQLRCSTVESMNLFSTGNFLAGKSVLCMHWHCKWPDQVICVLSYIHCVT